ncbi:MAG: helix-turn-helix transcriptional regulator [Thermodesulfovibrionales bacterium]
MEFLLDRNPTRESIVHLLKKHGGMSIDDMSKQIQITPMGVRQHLLALEKKGIVTYISKRKGIGRPGFIYMLTAAANNYFPNAYDQFALGMLRDIKQHEGTAKVDKIFAWRKDRLLATSKDELAGRQGIDDTVAGLTKFLEANGHLVELSRVNGDYHLRQYHCPIHAISAEFRDACRHELQMYKDLIGKDVTREHTISEGAPSCLYIIPRS